MSPRPETTARLIIVIQPPLVVLQLPAILIQLALAIVELTATILYLSLPIVILPLAIGALLAAALIAPIIIVIIVRPAIARMVSIINGLLNIADRVVNHIGVRQLAGEGQGADKQSGRVTFHKASLIGGLALR